MVLEPKFVLLDEPTSALDMSVQAQIVDLLRDLQKRHDLAYLFISHDLKVVRALSNYVVVLKNGKVVEEGPADEVFADRKRPTPRHCWPPRSISRWRSAPCWRRKADRAWLSSSRHARGPSCSRPPPAQLDPGLDLRVAPDARQAEDIDTRWSGGRRRGC